MIDFYLQPLALGETISTLEIPCIYLFLIYIIYNIYFLIFLIKGIKFHTYSTTPHPFSHTSKAILKALKETNIMHGTCTVHDFVRR